MNIITQCSLFGIKEVVYMHPVTGKRETIQCDEFHQGIEHANRTAILSGCAELYTRFDKYYTDLLKFADVSPKAKQHINQARAALAASAPKVSGFKNLDEMAAHVYENVLPYLHTCTIKNDKYFEILKTVETQVLKFSANHQFLGETPENVKP